MSDRLVVIDGNSLVNRAYYAIQRPMITKEGLYTQGVYGFLTMLNKIQNDYEPKYMAVAFDMKAPTFRHREYEEYKAGRKKMPVELSMQIPVLKDVLDAMKIKRIELEGYEADDIIGTVAVFAEAQGLEPLIITGDKDELQLATDVTKVIITKKGISEFDIYDRQAMIDKYGFTPTQFIDFKGLRGDPSDNIPGIPGVGEKTAQKLIVEYGSVENLLQNLDKMPKNKLREKIEDNAMQAMMSKRLATIFTSVPVELNLEDFLLQAPDMDRLISLYSKLEFNSLLKRLRASGSNAPDEGNGAAGDSEANREGAGTICTEESSENNGDCQHSDSSSTQGADVEFQDYITSDTWFIKVFTDNNHVDTPSLSAVSCMRILDEGSMDHRFFSSNDGVSLPEEFGRFWTDEVKSIAGHDVKRDLYALMCHGYPAREVKFDTAVAAYLLDPVRRGYELPDLAFELFHMTMETESDVTGQGVQMDLFGDLQSDLWDRLAAYGKLWLETAWRLAGEQRVQLGTNQLNRVMTEAELPLIEVLASMEVEGIYVDRKQLDEAGKSLTAAIEQLTSAIYNLAGEEFKINSPKQLGVILFEKLGLPAGKKTKTGYSTNAEVLEGLKDVHPIVPMVLEYRTLTKLNSTYVEGLLPLIDRNGKIHAHFQQTVTATGRLSCTEPNLQNIPVKQELGRGLRRAFVPGVSAGSDEGDGAGSPKDDEWVFVGADYSQIELRVLAHMSGEEDLIGAFVRGDDIHRMTASKVFGVPEDQVTALQRSNAKVVNFGIIYGMSGFGLSSELSITRREAEKYIQDYFRQHPAVREFMDECVESCRETGYVTTLLGRRRQIKEINGPGRNVQQLGERLAMNTPVQGTAADIIKLAMIKAYNMLRDVSPESKLVLQIHDELIIRTKKSDAEIVKKTLEEAMESAVELRVPLKAEAAEGSSWYELK